MIRLTDFENLRNGTSLGLFYIVYSKNICRFCNLTVSSIQKNKNPNVSAWHIIKPGQQEKINQAYTVSIPYYWKYKTLF